MKVLSVLVLGSSAVGFSVKKVTLKLQLGTVGFFKISNVDFGGRVLETQTSD